ncbi:hypothetical protein FQN57_006311 [Myotisia sp. PD_48]|nr:hypothetical protein FQN57_006311 [Myotisia sp. PD_48]
MAPIPANRGIIELATTISNSVARLQEVLTAEGIPPLSFQENAPIELPKGALEARDAVLDATAELHDLILDPLTLLFKNAANNNLVSQQAISRLGIANIVPLGGQVSYADIAQEVGLSESMIKRVVRHAMTMHIFYEPEPGMVAHTKVSKLLRLPHLHDWVGTGSEEMWPAAVKLVDAIQQWPDSQEPNETAFALANGVSDTMYNIVHASPTRAARFSGAMKAFTSGAAFDISHLLDNYDWASLGQVQVVDIGGARGHVALRLAQKFENLNIIVQDLENVVAGAEENLPKDLKKRVNFMVHDFFTPQRIAADVYILRWILHNWSNKYCFQILRALIPALAPGARILIVETCMPEPGKIAFWRELRLRSMDLNMAATFNSQERSIGEWKCLLKEADSRFELKKVIEPRGSALAIIDVLWGDKEDAIA